MDAPYFDTIDGHEFRIKFRPITNNARGKIEDILGASSRRRRAQGGNEGMTLSDEQIGTAQMMAIAGCVEKIVIDDEEYTVGEFGMQPAYYDEDRDLDAMEILLREIVGNPKNKILLKRYPQAFREFTKNRDGSPLVAVGDLDPTQ